MRAAREIMAELAGTGMTPDQIALVMELSAAVSAEARPVVDEAAARRRERDKEYQAQKRAERRQSLPISADVADAPLSLPPNDNNSNPPTHTPEKQNPPARKGHRLPDDWQPKPLTGDAAQAVAGWPPGAMERELSRFRDWAASATGPNSRKSNWDAAWRNWIRKTEDDGRYRASGRQPSGQRGGSTRGAASLALERLGYG